MGNYDFLRIKARAAELGIKMKDLCVLMRSEEGVDCQISNLSRARTREVKTEGDMNLLNAADAVLKRLEAKQTSRTATS